MPTWKKMLVGWLPAMVAVTVLTIILHISHLESFLLGAAFGGVGAQVGLVLMRGR